MSFRTVYDNDWSENGWRMCNRDECVVANPVPFSDTAPVRKGDAATVLNAWLIWYHRNVEPITSPVWGWSATNEVGDSNHLAGTGIDINAPKYPWGVDASVNMPAARIAKIREGLRLFEGTVYWGNDWNRRDPMHFQIGFREGDARVRNFAEKLNRGHLGIYGDPQPAPVPPPNEIDREAQVASGWIGKRKFAGERPCKDGVGRYADFDGGSVYWHPAANVDADKVARAVAVPTHIYETWKAQQWEQGPLGYPTRRHAVVDGVGDIQAFQGGVVYRRYGQPGFVVHGAIGARWAELGSEKSAYGWPVSDEFDADGGRAQRFEHGVLRWHRSGVVGDVEGAK
ncbi:hypothetical protein M2280_004031 [Prescottella agglutinans]|uniref:Peptidase M15C domain-containing protein n=1 Tax=Prescottella agglutinans TaxID=1644129 RepID=A0ABT6MFY6_9NOCA|nr:M15 family metallopeptidase [Prescottella agglutinans]MDH6282794.1 hypothetical protein [Prescottella agglutinans]